MKRLVIVKGKNCFIFVDEYASTPINAFPLEGLYAELENRKKPDKKSVTVSPEGKNSLSSSSLSTILLRSVSTEKIAYQISFDMKGDKTIVDKFLEASASSLSYIDGKVRLKWMSQKLLKSESSFLILYETNLPFSFII